MTQRNGSVGKIWREAKMRRTDEGTVHVLHTDSYVDHMNSLKLKMAGKEENGGRQDNTVHASFIEHRVVLVHRIIQCMAS